ncbi:MAG: hypothetical protein JW845_07615 [Dehalococcoidales bacterium]|nr:hypothetical protein [Dehalococcoidales bacterium]
MENITKLEWKILDDVSSSFIGTATMKKQGLSLRKLRETVFDLYQRGILYEIDKRAVKYEKLMTEPTEQMDIYNEYAFGLTELGSDLWAEGSKKYSKIPVDWTKASILVFDPPRGKGFVEGTTKEVCLTKLNEWSKEYRWQPEKSTIIHKEIEGFKPYYHKHLTGGHRITFKIKKIY